MSNSRRKLFLIGLFVVLGMAALSPALSEQQKEPPTTHVVAIPSSRYATCMQNIELFTKPLSESFVVIAAVFAAYQYWRTVRTRRSEWLFSMFHSFYQTAKYQRIRSLLDWHEAPETLQLMAEVENLRNTPDIQRFNRYLNFFEFVGVLRYRDQLTEDEVCDLFEYDLKNLNRLPVVRAYVEKHGFERLNRLLSRIEVQEAKS